MFARQPSSPWMSEVSPSLSCLSVWVTAGEGPTYCTKIQVAPCQSLLGIEFVMVVRIMSRDTATIRAMQTGVGLSWPRTELKMEYSLPKNSAARALRCCALATEYSSSTTAAPHGCFSNPGTWPLTTLKTPAAQVHNLQSAQTPMRQRYIFSLTSHVCIVQADL